MATKRSNTTTQTERSLWQKVLVADLSREGRLRSIHKRIDRASDLADLAVQRYRERITWRSQS